jgi:hypothetical protein
LYEESQKIKAKKEALAQQTPDGCTFAPQITTKARKPGVATGQERFEHLYRNAAATQKKIDFEREKVRVWLCCFSVVFAAFVNCCCRNFPRF